MWREYTIEKQTYQQLATKYQCSIKTIQRHLDKAEPTSYTNRTTKANIIMDTTYFGRNLGLMVFIDNKTKTVLNYKIIKYETNELYRQGINKLLSQGITIKSITCDGRRGLLGGFKDIPTQMCHFHQTQIIRRYLTTRPRHISSQELRLISLNLKPYNQKSFSKALDNWYLKHEKYFNERTVNLETGKSRYTHERLRKAYRSLQKNQQILFIYQSDNDENIAHTINALEGLFSELKRQLNCHKGLNYQRNLHFINDFLYKRMGE